MPGYTLPSLGLVLLGSVSSVSAFWRMECRGNLGTARIDPIVNPGVVSYHAHNLFGAQNIGFSSTPETIVDSSCTSCKATQDKSNYWTPTLYFMADDGTFTQVENEGGMLAYYLLYGDNITAFPSGFQMVAGDASRRNFSLAVPDPPKSDWTGNDVTQVSLAQKAVGWNCLDYAATPEASLYRHEMPNKTYMDNNCPDGMRLELMFPSCWNGEKDSSDHKSHVAYPNLVMTGDCPSDYEQRLPSLFYETIYNTAAFKDKSGSFVLSNGDATGTSYHGDFMMGWESQDFLQQAVDTCTNASGELSDCPLFTLQADSDASECTLDLPSLIANEKVAGPLQQLPGGMQVTYGPEPVPDNDTGVSVSVPVVGSSATSSSTFSQTAAGYASASTTITDNYGGGIFAQESATGSSQDTPTSVAQASSTSTSQSSSPSTTTTSAPSTTAPQEKPLWTSIYTSAGQEVHMVMMEEDVTVTMPATATSTAAAKRHLHEHQHRHLRHKHRF